MPRHTHADAASQCAVARRVQNARSVQAYDASHRLVGGGRSAKCARAKRHAARQRVAFCAVRGKVRVRQQSAQRARGGKAKAQNEARKRLVRAVRAAKGKGGGRGSGSSGGEVFLRHFMFIIQVQSSHPSYGDERESRWEEGRERECFAWNKA